MIRFDWFLQLRNLFNFTTALFFFFKSLLFLECRQLILNIFQITLLRGKILYTAIYFTFYFFGSRRFDS